MAVASVLALTQNTETVVDSTTVTIAVTILSENTSALQSETVSALPQPRGYRSLDIMFVYCRYERMLLIHSVTCKRLIVQHFKIVRTMLSLPTCEI